MASRSANSPKYWGARSWAISSSGRSGSRKCPPPGEPAALDSALEPAFETLGERDWDRNVSDLGVVTNGASVPVLRLIKGRTGIELRYTRVDLRGTRHSEALQGTPRRSPVALCEGREARSHLVGRVHELARELLSEAQPHEDTARAREDEVPDEEDH